MRQASEVGQAVRELRLAHGLSQEKLAQQIGLKADQVSKSETGTRRFDLAELSGIADALGTSVQTLLGRREPGTLALAARVTEAASEGGLTWVEQRARQILELDHLLGELGCRRPSSGTREAAEVLVAARALPESASKKQANLDGQSIADLTRHKLDLGSAPLGDLGTLSEQFFGVDVDCAPLGEGVSGVCVHSDDIALIMANTDMSIGHLRFTLAHELAHHVFGDPREVVIERKLWQDTTVERRANAFAANLIMPPTEVERMVGDRPMTDELLAELMQHFNVSLVALVGQLADCKKIEFEDQEFWKAKPAGALISRFGDPGQANPAAMTLEARAPYRLMKSARDGEATGRMGGTVLTALMGVAQPVFTSAGDTEGSDELGTSEVLEAFAGL